jgi:hypothetical protein
LLLSSRRCVVTSFRVSGSRAGGVVWTRLIGIS